MDSDSVKQYALLWSYNEELKRACHGNNCKLHIERPALRWSLGLEGFTYASMVARGL